VVDIPSPLSTYRLRSPTVSIQSYLDRGEHYPTQRVAASSNAVCGLIRAASVGRHAGFLDARPALRAAGGRQAIHGPRDFKHFNRAGMEALGQAVAARIDRPLAPAPCEQIAD